MVYVTAAHPLRESFLQSRFLLMISDEKSQVPNQAEINNADRC